jgi:hypothetical protein
LTRARTGLAESAAEINKPFWSKKTNPDELPVVG